MVPLSTVFIHIGDNPVINWIFFVGNCCFPCTSWIFSVQDYNIQNAQVLPDNFWFWFFFWLLDLWLVFFLQNIKSPSEMSHKPDCSVFQVQSCHISIFLLLMWFKLSELANILNQMKEKPRRKTAYCFFSHNHDNHTFNLTRRHTQRHFTLVLRNWTV